MEINYLQDISMDFDDVDDDPIHFTELTEDSSDLEEQKRTLEKITSDLQQLNNMMNDLNNIIIIQSEDINIIDDTVYEANELVEGGKEELKKAEVYQSKYRQKLFGLSIGALIGGLVFSTGGVVLGTTHALIGGGIGSGAGAVFGYFST